MYDIDQPIQDALRNLLIQAGEKHMALLANNSAPTTTVVTASKQGRKQSGYNVFISQAFSELDKSIDSQTKMGLASKKWASISAEEKQKFQAIADQNNRILASAGVPGKKKQMSTYNFWYRENAARLKQEAADLGVSCMTHVGQVWRAVPPDERNQWAERLQEFLAQEASEESAEA